MPIYEHHRSGCDERFEVTCRLEEREQFAVCPSCRSATVEPVFGSFTCAATQVLADRNGRGRPTALVAPSAQSRDGRREGERSDG